MPKSTDPRHSSQYVMARRKWIAALARPSYCCICKREVLFGAGRSPWAVTVEHVYAVSLYPDMALDVEHWRPAHARCNYSKGNRMMVAKAAPAPR